jgi:hypothetical protein
LLQSAVTVTLETVKRTLSVFRIIFFGLLLLIPTALVLPPFARATVNIEQTPNTPWAAFPFLGQFVSLLLSNILVLAGLVFFLLIIGAGFGIIAGAGGSDPKGVQQGQEAFTWALIGFLIIFTSFFILQIIKVLTGIDIINSGL